MGERLWKADFLTKCYFLLGESEKGEIWARLKQKLIKGLTTTVRHPLWQIQLALKMVRHRRMKVQVM